MSKTHKEKKNDWHKLFMKTALLHAEKSDDDSMGVGCVIVGPNNEIRSTGYNGLVRGAEYTDKKRERPAKYSHTEHAERNAIYNAARVGTPLDGCSAYIVCTDKEKGGPVPCNDCTRALIQSGITKIYGVNVDLPKNEEENKKRVWVKTIGISLEMLEEAGVELILLDPNTFEETDAKLV